MHRKRRAAPRVKITANDPYLDDIARLATVKANRLLQTPEVQQRIKDEVMAAAAQPQSTELAKMFNGIMDKQRQ
jgi:hypothetical protein